MKKTVKFSKKDSTTYHSNVPLSLSEKIKTLEDINKELKNKNKELKNKELLILLNNIKDITNRISILNED